MKISRIFLFFPLVCATLSSAGQTLHIKDASVTYSFNAADTGDMVFNPGNTLKVMGRTFSLTDQTSMWTDEVPVEDNVVTVFYSGDSAEVNVAGNIASYVDATVSGAHVSIIQSDMVSADTCGEITYHLSGGSADGSFYLEGSFKSTVELAGVDLTSSKGSPLDIQNGKRVNLRMTGGMVNYLSDAPSGSQKGCVVCKGHLELKGDGTLTVAGNASHAIYAKEYIEMSGCTVNVVSAVKDGINCNQYFTLKSGTLNISGVDDDGIQVSYKDDTDREAEDTGAVNLKGGRLTVSVTADAAKGVKCEGPMSVSGGDIDVTVSGDGIWDSAKSKTKASACLASDTDMTISGGRLTLTATGGGGKGINCDGKMTVDDGYISIKTSGGIVAYVNGKLYTDYTGNTDRLASDMKSSPKGIKADGDIDINGGEIYVITTGNGAEGIESKAILTINEGEINVRSTDDAINSSSHMYIKGGNVTVIASGNDGLDSNGNLYIEGGYIMAFGSRSPECGIDANEEEGFTVIFTGGTLLAVGGNNSVPSASSGSVQPYVSANVTVSADSMISLSDSSGETLAIFTVPSDYTSPTTGGNRPGGMGSNGGLLITCPDLTVGSSYTLRTGTSSTTVTARQTGSSGWRP